MLCLKNNIEYKPKPKRKKKWSLILEGNIMFVLGNDESGKALHVE
jgi:hypothetical protein